MLNLADHGMAGRGMKRLARLREGPGNTRRVVSEFLQMALAGGLSPKRMPMHRSVFLASFFCLIISALSFALENATEVSLCWTRRRRTDGRTHEDRSERLYELFLVKLHDRTESFASISILSSRRIATNDKVRTAESAR